MAVGSFLDGPTMAIIVSFTQPMTPDILPSSLRPVSTSYLSLGVSGKRSQPRRTPTRRTIATDMTRTETTTVFSPTLHARRSPPHFGGTPRKEQDEERPASRTHEQELAEQNQGAAASTTNDFSCFYLDEELSDLVIESSSKTTAPTEEATISGRRIITPSHFIKCLWELERHESHGHRYTAKSGLAVIIGAATKKILYIGVRNKFCSYCEYYKQKDVMIPKHTCYKNCSTASTAMESDILVEGFQASETMHGLQYRTFIGDGDSSVHNQILCKVSYGHLVEKVECANHVVKCYTTKLFNIRK
ncbi:hypothetical protein HPB47_017291, partial [Ixodes persulcatus]